MRPGSTNSATQGESSGSFNLSLLAEFALSGPAGVRIEIGSKKNRALLAVLALSPGQTVTRERLASLLWGDHGEEQARNSLRQSLAVLRKELGPSLAESIQSQNDVLTLRMREIVVDALTVLQGMDQEDISVLRKAARSYSGELLADLALRDEAFGEWLAAERSRLKSAAIKLYDKLVEREYGDDRIDAAQQLLAIDCLREASHRSLMYAYAAQGDKALALKQFEQCRAILHEQLGVEPSAETQELRRQIAEGECLPSNAVLTKQERTTSQTDGKLPSIAVMPFVDISADPTHSYICDGISENIITGLSRFRDLHVIASQSTFAYKGKAIKIQDISRELGVRFILEGNIQKANERIRIATQLVDGFTGADLWAERFDRSAEDIFTVLDEVTEIIVARLATAYGGRVGKAWRRRAERSSPQNFQAYDYFQRGLDTFLLFTQGCTASARECFQKAIELDPDYGKSYAKMAWAHLCDVWLGWSEDVDYSMAEALKFSNLAIARDDDEAWGHWAMAGYHMFGGQHDRAITSYERALELNPNDADVMNDFGQCLSYAGRAKEGLEMVRKAMRLNPHYPEYWTFQLGPIFFDAHQYPEAITTLESLRLLDTIGVHLYLAASHAALGHVELARAAVARVMGFDAQATIQSLAPTYLSPYKNAEDRDHLRHLLLKAGLPEFSADDSARVPNSTGQNALPSR